MKTATTTTNILSQQLRQIVLADGDVEACYLFKTILYELAPHSNVLTIHNGDELLEFVKHMIPDLLFLNEKMPCHNAMECLQQLKSNPELLHLPIIVYGSLASQRELNLAYGYGASLYIKKPALQDELRSTLKNILQLNWANPNLITQEHFIKNNYVAFKQDRPFTS